MKRTPSVVLAVLAGLIAIATPVLVSIQLSRRQSLDEESAHAGSMAADVLRRADEAGEQFARAVLSFDSHITEPCSEASMAAMRDLDVSSSQLQMIGYIKGDRLMCSSLGKHGKGIPVGPVDYVTPQGAGMRVGTVLPISSTRRFLIGSSQAGFAVVIHPDLVIDVAAEPSDLAVGVVASSNGHVLLRRGAYETNWWKALGKDQYSLDLFDGRNVVALRRSRKWDTVAFVALPARQVDTRIRRFAAIFVPLGIFLGLALGSVFALALRQHLSLPALIKVGIKKREFYLVYQPLVNLQTGKWCGAEALIRWRRPDGEIVSPDRFIPVAEESGLMPKITNLVLDLVFEDAKLLLRGRTDFHIGINVGASDLESNAIVARLEEHLRRTGIEASCLMLEATERSFLNTSKANAIVSAIRQLGIPVAIDDFGTGYSSLSYLTTLEVDYLKIDKAFVDTIGIDAATSDVVGHIISMAKSLNLKMIAEGVETEGQAIYLRENGVHYAQGWFYAKGMTPAELVRELDGRQSNP